MYQKEFYLLSKINNIILYLLLTLLTFNSFTSGVNVNYNGYKVFQIIPKNEKQQKILEMMHSTNHFDFWSKSRVLNHPTVIMVGPKFIENFHHIMKTNQFEFSEIIHNVNKLKTSCSCSVRVCKDIIYNNFFFEQYNCYKAINMYLKCLEKQHPNLISTFTIARSTEGRDILGVKISNSIQKHNKPAILIDGGIHAREWISSATSLYFIHQLVENKTNHRMFHDVDWYIIPLMNPDGYIYSQKTDRLWRKNRSKGKYCVGVDGNRNYDYHWLQGGASSNECSEVYAGPRPFSEPETRGLRDLVVKHKHEIKLYITLHSYGDFIIYPWSYTTLPASDHCELQEIGEKIRDAIESVNGRKYTVGSSNDILYLASGNSEDWMKGVAGIKLSFAIELPGGGEEGFDIPAKKILCIGIETFAGIKTLHDYLIR